MALKVLCTLWNSKSKLWHFSSLPAIRKSQKLTNHLVPSPPEQKKTIGVNDSVEGIYKCLGNFIDSSCQKFNLAWLQLKPEEASARTAQLELKLCFDIKNLKFSLKGEYKKAEASLPPTNWLESLHLDDFLTDMRMFGLPKNKLEALRSIDKKFAELQNAGMHSAELESLAHELAQDYIKQSQFLTFKSLLKELDKVRSLLEKIKNEGYESKIGLCHIYTYLNLLLVRTFFANSNYPFSRLALGIIYRRL